MKTTHVVLVQVRGLVAGLPDFVPAPGMRANINLNNLSDIDPCPQRRCWYTGSSGINAPWLNWTGAANCEDYSEFGAMAFWGGGHGGGEDTSCKVFDTTTRKWIRIGDPVPFDFTKQLDPEWRDYDHNGSRVIPGMHTYCHAQYRPPRFGGGAKGSFFVAYLVYEGGRIAPHEQALDSGKWKRSTAGTQNPYLANGPYGGGFLDTKRGIYWSMPGVLFDHNYRIDFNQKLPAPELVRFWGPGFYARVVYVEEHDMAIAFQDKVVDGKRYLATVAFDLTQGTPRPTTLNVAGTMPLVYGPGYGADFCTHNGKFYCYEGRGERDCIVLSPPSDWRRGEWTIAREAFDGPPPASLGIHQGNQPFSKWAYNNKLRSFMWSEGNARGVCLDGVERNGIFQLWRPRGT